MKFSKRNLMGKEVLNDKELLIIKLLRKNSRHKLTVMSKITGLAASSIFDMIKRLEESLITNHTILINLDKIGFHGRANIALKLNPDARTNLINYLSKHENINSIYRLHNGYDLLIECIFRNIAEVDNFTEELEKKFNIKDKKVFNITEEIQREKFLT